MVGSMQFKLHKPFEPTGDQPTAIAALTAGIVAAKQHQVLLGVTGSGKTFTMANIIANTQLPTLIIAHNKTLAAQLYQEFRDFFPENAVSYFVSYYDYYQPEAYIPSSDTYIEKEATINDEIDKLRLAATTNLLTRKDSIVIASVSCIYNLGSPVEYGEHTLELMQGEIISRETVVLGLANLQYERSDMELKRGTYRLRGDIIQVWPAYLDTALSIETLQNEILSIQAIDSISGAPLKQETHKKITLYPAKHYLLNQKSQVGAFAQIEQDLQEQIIALKEQGKVIEAYRLQQKVTHDLDMLKELGYVNGVENYSRYFDGRAPGDPPFTLIDYFAACARKFTNGSFLTFVDESHITLPQVRGMYHGDQSRKETLIEYGFRLPSALDNRPLRFTEFQGKLPQTIYVSATPEELELSLAGEPPVEQLIRPTGLVDPPIIIRPIDGQIEDLVMEILARKQIEQRTLVTTLTKRMAEALTEYLNDERKITDLVADRRAKIKALASADTSDSIRLVDDLLPVESMEVGPIPTAFLNATQHLTTLPAQGSLQFPKVAYLHSDIETLERSDILADLRRGIYDVVVGINLLREGLDLPEVSLVAILDADKEGFLRSRTALIQTMGRAARHETGQVILYANNLTKSMKAAITESQRRRVIQLEYNKTHGITAQGIAKPIRDRMTREIAEEELPGHGAPEKPRLELRLNKSDVVNLADLHAENMTPSDLRKMISALKRKMNEAAKDMDYELAAVIRDTIRTLEN